MEQKSDRERRGDVGWGWGGRRRERERERVLSFGIRIHEKNKEKKPLVLDPTMEKVEGFQFQKSQGMNGKTGIPRETVKYGYSLSFIPAGFLLPSLSILD